MEPEQINLKSTVINELNTLPGLILVKGGDIYTKRQQIEEWKLALKVKESTILNIVESEGLLSNKEKREAESNRRLKEDTEYQNQKILTDNLKIEIDNLALNLEYINNKFRAAKALSRLLGE